MKRILHRVLIGSFATRLAFLFWPDLTVFQYDYIEREKTISSPVIKESSLQQANSTIVTAFFNLPTSRHSIEWYMENIQNLFLAHDAMIIFTSPDLVQNFTALRAKSQRTVVVATELNEFRTAHLFDNHTGVDPAKLWNETLRLRARKTSVQDPSVYWIWHEKVEFLKRASDWNPFQSNFFAWFDAGMVRWEKYTNTTLLQRIPPELPPDSMMMLNVTRILHSKEKQMGAGVFGGYKLGVDRYHERYYQVLQEAGVNKNYASLSLEQYVMYDTCTQTERLCTIIRPERRNWTDALKHPYFYMLPFLNTQDYARMKKERATQEFFGEYSLP